MKQILILLGLFFYTLNLAFAQCSYRPPQPQAEIRQKSSVNITQGTIDLNEAAKVTLKEAKKIATAKYAGKVKEAKLIVEDGTLAWKLEVKGKQGQKEIFIDPANGAFLGYGLTK